MIILVHTLKDIVFRKAYRLHDEHVQKELSWCLWRLRGQEPRHMGKGLNIVLYRSVPKGG